MRLLVDTHAFFWWVNDSPQLTRRARDALSADSNEVLISAVVAWELATKVRLGKWPEPPASPQTSSSFWRRTPFAPLAMTIAHARLAGSLPGRHRDPFDRMLAAQAVIEDASLITADPAFRAFGTRVLW